MDVVADREPEVPDAGLAAGGGLYALMLMVFVILLVVQFPLQLV